jgi:hypothetical protein
MAVNNLFLRCKNMMRDAGVRPARGDKPGFRNNPGLQPGYIAAELPMAVIVSGVFISIIANACAVR